MFQTSTWIGLGVVAAVATLHHLGRVPVRAPDAGRPRARAIEGLLLTGLGVSVLVLLVTGFQASLFTDARLTGFALLLHCAAGLVFAVGLAIAAFLWAEDCRFGRRAPGPGDAAERFDAFEKVLFWLLCLSGLVSVLAVVVSTASIFGPPALQDLYEAHRYGSLLVVCLILIYTYRTVIWKPRARRIRGSGGAGTVQERDRPA